MKTFGHRLIVSVQALALASAVLVAASPDGPATGKTGHDTPARPAGAHPAMATTPGGTGASFGTTHGTAILGAAWNNDNSPIKKAHLQLRNVVTGHIDGTTVANDAGQFAFADVNSGSYLVELVSNAGHIVTVGQVFTIAPGETVATFVRVAAKAPWFEGFFSNVAQAVSSSAASEGVTAIAPVVREASPQAPPSVAGGGS